MSPVVELNPVGAEGKGLLQELESRVHVLFVSHLYSAEPTGHADVSVTEAP